MEMEWSEERDNTTESDHDGGTCKHSLLIVYLVQITMYTTDSEVLDMIKASEIGLGDFSPFP